MGDLIACCHCNGSSVHPAFVLHPLVLEPDLELTHHNQTNEMAPLDGRKGARLSQPSPGTSL